MSFLENEEAKQSSFWDWVVGIGLILLIGGFTVYYKYQKRSSVSRFQQADSLYQANNYRDAEHIYEELKSAQYLTTKDDSVISVRLDSIETVRELDNAVLNRGRSRISAGDSAGAWKDLRAIRSRELLSPENQAWLDSALKTPAP